MKTQFFEVRVELPNPKQVTTILETLNFKAVANLMQDSLFVTEEAFGSARKDGCCLVFDLYPSEECLERKGGFNRSKPALLQMVHHLKEMFPKAQAIEVYGYSDKPDKQYSSVLWNWRYDCVTDTYLQCEMPETLQFHFSIREDQLPSHASRALLEFLIRNHEKTARELLRYH